MISIIVTSYKEPNTIGRAVKAIADSKIKEKHEILVGAPDEETILAASKLKNKYKNLRVIQDLGKGKPAALNLLVKKAKGDILVLTDGDVYLKSSSLIDLIRPFKDKRIGAVSGRPVSTDERNNKLGFWAYMLTEVANEWRINALKKNRRFFCSGYLFSIRKNLFPILSEELLSEDGYISDHIYKKGYKIGYSQSSEVYVKYPDNFRDWIKQKKRSAGGYNQIKKISGIQIRSFKSESLGGLDFFKYPKSIKELIWLMELFLSRVYLWAVIYKDVNLRKRSRAELWPRILSTK